MTSKNLQQPRNIQADIRLWHDELQCAIQDGLVEDDEIEEVLQKLSQITHLALRATDPDGWRPIETAPKDGTPIIGKSPGGVFDCRWVEPEEAAEIDGGEPDDYLAGWGPVDDPYDTVAPQYWIPMPDLPEEDQP